MKREIYVAAYATLLAAGTTAQANYIDLFTEPAGGTSVVSDASADGTPVYLEYEEPSGSDTILGNYRDLIVNKTSGSGTGESELKVEEGMLQFSNASNTEGTGIVQWDGQDSGEPNVLEYGLNADLVNQDGCGLGCDNFAFEAVDPDLDFQYKFAVYTTATDYAVVAFGIASSDGPLSFNIPFSTWESAATGTSGTLGTSSSWTVESRSGSVSMSDVNAIELILNSAPTGTARLDVSLMSITKSGPDEPEVPAPATLALLGLGLAGIGMVRRRRGGCS